MSGEWDDPPDAAARWGWDDPNTTADKPATPRLTVLSALDAMNEPAPTEIVEGVAWAGCVTVLVAESSAGKTFVALDLAAAVSAGLSWHGRAVSQGSVLHVGYEGDAIGLRLRAIHVHRKAALTHVYRVRANAPLSPIVTRDGETASMGEVDVRTALKVTRDKLSADELPPLVLIVFDTVRASMSGSEDSSESVSAYLRVIRRLLESAPGAAALLVHHAGWQDGDTQKKRERGSSAFRGNVDATLYLEAGEYQPETESAPLTLHTHKVRDGEKPPELRMIRQRVTFDETDPHGKPITSCVIDPDGRSPADFAAERATKAADADRRTDLAVLRAIQRTPSAATSYERIREAAGLKKEHVNASISRLIQLGWLDQPEKQRHPYTLTADGLRALAQP